MSRLTIWDLNYLLKFWIVLHFLQKPLAWSSKFYLHVQSKSCGRNIRCYSSFLNFFEFWAKVFQTFGQKTSRNHQNYFLRVQMNNFWLAETFKSFESFWIFCRNLWEGSQNSIYVSRVKIALETVFLFFFSEFFSDFERKIFETFGHKTSRSCQTNICVSTGTTWGFKFFKSFEPFWIFYRNLWHGSQKSIYVSRVKIAEETVFRFFFSEFFPIFSENFFRLSARKLQENVKTTFWVSRGTICSLNFFF